MDTLEEFIEKLPTTGEMIRYVRPTVYHRFKNVIANNDKLVIGESYEVEDCKPASSWTKITLKQFGPEIWFDLGSFEKCDQNKK